MTILNSLKHRLPESPTLNSYGVPIITLYSVKDTGSLLNNPKYYPTTIIQDINYTKILSMKISKNFTENTNTLGGKLAVNSVGIDLSQIPPLSTKPTFHNIWYYTLPSTVGYKISYTKDWRELY